MKLRIHHRTRYDYALPVRQNANEARLLPPDGPDQRRSHFELRLLPAVSTCCQRDFYGNDVHFFEIAEAHQTLSVEALSEVETRDSPVLADDSVSVRLDTLRTEFLPYPLADFTTESTYVAGIGVLLNEATAATGATDDVWQASRALMAHVHRTFVYKPGVTHSGTTMTQALELRSGVCQDFAHAMIGYCRSIGIPARYVSGYIYNGPHDQLKGAQATHAWVEVWIPAVGWAGLDPTNNHASDGRYVKAAIGRDYADAAPLKGTYRGTERRTLSVEVVVSLRDPAISPSNPTPDSTTAAKPRNG